MDENRPDGGIRLVINANGIPLGTGISSSLRLNACIGFPDAERLERYGFVIPLHTAEVLEYPVELQLHEVAGEAFGNKLIVQHPEHMDAFTLRPGPSGFERPIAMVNCPGDFMAHAATVMPNHIAMEVVEAGWAPFMTVDQHIEDGWIILGDAPGIGISVDETAWTEWEPRGAADDWQDPQPFGRRLRGGTLGRAAVRRGAGSARSRPVIVVAGSVVLGSARRGGVLEVDAVDPIAIRD